ncbi:hypothetical protein DEO72_LG2g3158 [Vigna unguiculata]|uniref:Uncharacterized protein n=1 Tax=Vigna unguiculata TaxID=3917 RepID=A0A4D6L2Q5_VIGUN|nr:hypothetical protein DEO72_LG2g3158 [Vigna unguiculata]
MLSMHVLCADTSKSHLRSSDPHDPLLRNGQVLVFYFRIMTLSLGMVKSRPSAKQWSLISWLHRGPLRGNGHQFLYIKTLSFGMVIDSLCRIETLSVRMVVDSPNRTRNPRFPSIRPTPNLSSSFFPSSSDSHAHTGLQLIRIRVHSKQNSTTLQIHPSTYTLIFIAHLHKYTQTPILPIITTFPPPSFVEPPPQHHSIIPTCK